MDEINSLWRILAIFLVLSMQAGFLLLEGGRVRSKNSVNVAQKNVTDLVVTWIGFLAVGFTLMYGVGIPQLVGTESSAKPGPDLLDFLFQFCFCCTTATILSGAVSERISFRAYIVLVLVIAVIAYPIAGRLVWGNSYDENAFAPLANLGFIDFAGATVVHGVGGWFGLVTLYLIGPRIGRFNENGEVQPFASHSSVIALFGVLLLLFGWIGFNAGALAINSPFLELVIFNTVSAAVFGASSGMLVGSWLDKGIFNPGRMATGMLGGLVASTAGVIHMSSFEAMLIGLLGGVVATYGAHIMLYKYKLDDPVDAIATHGFAGVLGTLAVAFVAPPSLLVAGSRMAQLFVQFAGALVIFIISCALCCVTVFILRRFMDFRVSEHAEKIGLNYSEHGETVGLERLTNALENEALKADTFGSVNVVDSDEEHSELAAALNKVIGKYELANQSIVAANERFQQFAETASDWLWETNEEVHVSFLHANSTHGLDVQISGVIGMPLLKFLNVEYELKKQLDQHIKNRDDFPVFEATTTYDLEESLSLLVEVRGVPFYCSEGEFRGYRGTITDISARKEAENKALFLSFHDELTGLANRRALSENLSQYLTEATDSNRSVVVAGVDLDGFKEVNDAYGHLMGDRLLEQVASRFELFLRSTDYVYRTGGDEFVVVLTDLEPRVADRVARAVLHRLMNNLSEMYFVKTVDIRVGASIGIAKFPEQAKDPDDLLRLADLALYEAKAQGKGRVVCFEPEMDIDAKMQLKIQEDLRKALAENEFYLLYQPQVDSHSNRITGFEALIRWSHPERGEIPPGDFIAEAEKLKLMDEIGTFVLDRACEFAASWPLAEDGNPYRISVNVSPQQFQNKEFCNTVRTVIERHKIPATQLELEITEDVLVHDFQAVASMLKELRDMNVSVAIDDFGSGQTSLRYLNQFPISTIKIDRSFIKHLNKDGKAAEITQTMVGLGRRLGMKVLAEGVEDVDQLSMLQSWDCDQIQGFLFSKPLSEEHTRESMENGCLAPPGRRHKDGRNAA
ncbi:MAG: EAL domain-containing protein [Granulosicoccus sp.]